MRNCYAGSAAALRDALRYSVERGGASSLGVLYRDAGSSVMLAGDDATAQAGHIRRQLDRLQSVPRALLIVAYAPPELGCNCRARCCAGSYPNPEWREALDVILAHIAPLFAGHAPNIRLRMALAANLLTRKHETAISLAARYGVHRKTVAEYTSILEAALIGTRHKAGELDAAFTRFDTLLRNAGIVATAGGTAQAA